MKKVKIFVAILICVASLLQLTGCGSDEDNLQETKAPVTGATVFQALKTQVDFDSTLTEVPDAESLFENLPEGSDVTLHKGPEDDSDQLGMVQVPNSSDLEAAEDSVNNYLQDAYDSVYASDPEAAKKFENVAIWKYDVYIVFCITVNYTEATQIINNTVNSGNTTNQTPSQDNENPAVNNGGNSAQKPDGGATGSVAEGDFNGRWEISGHPVVYDYFENLRKDRNVYLDIAIADGCVTVSVNGEESNTYNTYEITQAHGYPCLLIDVGGEIVGFVMINSDMIGMINSYMDSGRVKELVIQGKKYNGAFQPFENIYMREGSGSTTMPQNLNMDTILSQADGSKNAEWKFFYYPVSNVLQIFGSSASQEFWLDGVFYVKGINSLEYIEEMTVPWAEDLPSRTIYTDHNFVITDNK